MSSKKELEKYYAIQTVVNKENKAAGWAGFLLFGYIVLQALVTFGAFSPKGYYTTQSDIAAAAQKVEIASSVSYILLFSAIVILLLTIAMKLTGLYKLLEYSLIKEVPEEKEESVQEETPTKPE